MGLKIINASTKLLVSTSDLRDHVRGSTADNALITAYGRAAQQYAEGYTRRSIYLQKYRLTLSEFPESGTIELPRSPGSTSSLASTSGPVTISYLQDGGSTWTEWSSTAGGWRLDVDQEPPRVELRYGEAWPTATRETGGSVRVDFHAGYASTASTWVSEPPKGIDQAIRLIVGHWYENREDVVIGTMTARVPRAADALLWMERVE